MAVAGRRPVGGVVTVLQTKLITPLTAPSPATVDADSGKPRGQAGPAVQRACLQLAGTRTDADCSQYTSQTRSAATAEGGRGANTKLASAAAAVRSLSWVTAAGITIRLHNECNQPGEGRRGPARLERPIMGSARPGSARSARSGQRGRRPRPSQGRPRPRSLSPLPEPECRPARGPIATDMMHSSSLGVHRTRSDPSRGQFGPAPSRRPVVASSPARLL